MEDNRISVVPKSLCPRHSVEDFFESVGQTSRAMSEMDNPDEPLDLHEPKPNVSSLSASLSSNPMSQFDHSGREGEIQFVAEIEGRDHSLE